MWRWLIPPSMRRFARGVADMADPDAIFDREPINDYRQAIWRIVAHFERFGIEVPDHEPLPFIAQLVADMYWVRDSRVRRDIRKFRGELR